MSDLGPEARALIDATRDADVPGRRAKDRVKRRVLARVAAVALAASGSTASTTTAASVGAGAGAALTAKTALVGLAMSALIAGGVATGVVATRGPLRPTTSATSSASVPAAPQVPVADLASASAPPAAEDPEPPAPAAPAALARAVSPRAVATAAESHPSARAETLEQELPLLASAQAALRSGDTDQALALLAEHARRFPQGALLEERRAAHALAMCRRGREAAAVAEGAAFVRDAPSSPLADRVRESCGLGHEP
jgi:hypothetical protein